MITKPMFGLVLLFLAACATTIPAGPTVKVTPLGTHAGELCNRDRAMIFEDPTGVRVLYDAGSSVLGGDDPRLGVVHVLLLSHAHGDHMGDQRLTALGAGNYGATYTLKFKDDDAIGATQSQLENTLTLSVQGTVAAVPEPGSWALLSIGLLGLSFCRRKK